LCHFANGQRQIDSHAVAGREEDIPLHALLETSGFNLYGVGAGLERRSDVVSIRIRIHSVLQAGGIFGDGYPGIGNNRTCRISNDTDNRGQVALRPSNETQSENS
jgi:hypothetical protein